GVLRRLAEDVRQRDRRRVRALIRCGDEGGLPLQAMQLPHAEGDHQRGAQERPDGQPPQRTEPDHVSGVGDAGGDGGAGGRCLYCCWTSQPLMVRRTRIVSPIVKGGQISTWSHHGGANAFWRRSAPPTIGIATKKIANAAGPSPWS